MAMIEIQPATMEDAPAILALQRLAYQTEAAIYDDYSLPPLVEELDSLRAQFGFKRILKAVAAGRLVGSVRALQRDDTCHIERLFVHPDHRRQGIGVVVADIPAIPIEAAAGLGIPSLAVGNFSWDWIYEGLCARDPRWGEVVEAFREGYARTGLLLRLPFSPAMESFPRREDIPLVAAAGRSRRKEIARITGCDPGRKWVLLSFTTLEWGAEALARVGEIEDCAFFTVLPLRWESPNLHALERERVPFSDVVASVDAVVSKPGFGILSDCVVNRKPLVYAERSDFREYPVLEEAVGRYLRNVHIPAAELYRGNLRPFLDRLERRPEPAERLTGGGADIAAARIAQLL